MRLDKLKAAFTVVEIIVVVLIVSILVAYIGISFSSISSRRVNTQTRLLVNDLAWMRQSAVAQHQTFRVSFDTLNKRYQIDRFPSGGGAPQLVAVKSLQVDSLSILPLPASISFDPPQGKAESKQIDLTAQGNSKQITIFADTGYIQWQ
tara:strand:+ start:185 stop:631 length:447 start_codon:yes stop_codon:yes gene_type:complete